MSMKAFGELLVKIITLLVGTYFAFFFIRTAGILLDINWFSNTTTESTMKLVLEKNGWNLLGDALAGIFAPITFIIVVISLRLQNKQLALQSDQLKQTVADMKEQTELARSSASANYKFALHEKRMAVYTRLRACAFALSMNATIDKETRDAILETLDDAKFIFGDDVIEHVKTLTTKTDEHMKVSYKEKRLSDKKNAEGLAEFEERDWKKALQERHSLEDWFFKNLTYERLEEQFESALKLPADIDLPNRKKKRDEPIPGNVSGRGVGKGPYPGGDKHDFP